MRQGVRSNEPRVWLPVACERPDDHLLSLHAAILMSCALLQWPRPERLGVVHQTLPEKEDLIRRVFVEVRGRPRTPPVNELSIRFCASLGVRSGAPWQSRVQSALCDHLPPWRERLASSIPASRPLPWPRWQFADTDVRAAVAFCDLLALPLYSRIQEVP